MPELSSRSWKLGFATDLGQRIRERVAEQIRELRVLRRQAILQASIWFWTPTR